MLHTEYQDSRACGFRPGDFFMFCLYKKYMTPGRDYFWPQGHNLNKLGRGLLGHATYQISRFYDFWF